MLSVAHRQTAMSGIAVENPPLSAEEILEDGEIEDGDESEEEVVETETVVVNEQDSQNAEEGASEKDSSVAPEQDPLYGSAEVKTISRQDSTYYEGHEMDDDYDASPMTAEERRKYKKHQRKRKRHKESKEKEQEKKERRRKRKMHAAEDGTEVDPEHAGSTSPHGKKRKKRKKHSRDKGSTSPDSYGSEEEARPHGHRRKQRQESERADYDEDYDENDPYSTAPSHHFSNASNNNSGTYYSPAYQKEGKYDSDSESGSDFQAQLAEYKNYKTKKIHGEDDSDDYYDNDKYKQYDSRQAYRKRGQNVDTRQRGQRSKKSRWDDSTRMDSEQSSRRGRRINDATYDYDDGYSERRPCKFFAEGNCLKGDDCTFIHDVDSQRNGYRSHRYSNQSRSRRRELCKYYLAGHCHHGDSCTYMHGEYPCKYFHTGVTCFSGDNCRFSHDPPTDETREIVENLKDIYNSVDDSWEISELAKVGVKAHSKPPPGVGLLPTPNMAPGGNATQSNIPSLFDIKVEPTAAFQRRIDENSIASLSLTDESEGPSEVGPDMHHSYQRQYTNPGDAVPNIIMKTGALLPTPVSIMPSNNANGQQDGGGDGFYDNFYEGDHNMPSMDAKEVGGSEEPKPKSDDDVIKTDTEDFIRIDNSTATEDEHSDVAADVKAPDFLPATQKALFMRIHQKRTSLESDKGDTNNAKNKPADSWTYSSDDEEKPMLGDGGIIKMDTDMPASAPATTSVTSASVESILKLIADKTSDITANVDTNLLSKVASVINMATATATTADHYNPASSTVTYNPAQVKASPRHSSSGSHNHHHRERKTSGSSNASPGHPSAKHHHHHPNPIRRRLSTQELSKEPTVIPLVTKQSGNTVHAAHPDPRLTLSRLLGVKLPHYTATLPRFSKDLILPGSGKMVGLKITLSSDDSKTTKRDPRLGRRKDPRLQKSNDPRLKNKNTAKSPNASTPDAAPRPSVPTKPSALLTKSSAVIPSLPELDLDLAHINSRVKESTDAVHTKSPPNNKPGASYSLPQHLKLPKLVKAPISSPVHDKDYVPPEEAQSTPPMPTIAPYDPRYMASGPAKSGPSLALNTAPYDPRVLSSQSAVPTGDLKKRTIQLPKLIPAPSYKPVDGTNGTSPPTPEGVPEGDQGDF